MLIIFIFLIDNDFDCFYEHVYIFTYISYIWHYVNWFDLGYLYLYGPKISKRLWHVEFLFQNLYENIENHNIAVKRITMLKIFCNIILKKDDGV